MKRTVVLIYSGGLDSTVLLYKLLADGDVVRTLSINYGQRHSREMETARNISSALSIDHRVADITAIKDLLAGSSQTSAEMEVPEGHWAEESMKKTVVPNRNMLMLAMATAWAISTKAAAVAYAAHAGDHAIYPDCRPAFAGAMSAAMALADWHQVDLLAPFTALSKAEIVRLGHQLGVPLSTTWSCYKGKEIHCGKCGTCVERREAFFLAGVTDQTVYEK